MHRMKEFMEKLEECAKHEFDKGVQHVDTEEMSKVIAMISDCAETLYHYSVYEAMKKEEEEEKAWDEEEKRYYRGQRRDSMGRFTSRGGRRSRMGYEEYMPEFYNPGLNMMRDMDMADGRMYYDNSRGGDNSGNSGGNYNQSSQGNGVRNTGSTSRYGYSHDEYMKEKQAHPGHDEMSKKMRMDKLTEYLNDLEQMAKETIMGMSPEEKQAWKVKLSKLVNM